jgi:hypothetical protein
MWRKAGFFSSVAHLRMMAPAHSSGTEGEIRGRASFADFLVSLARPANDRASQARREMVTAESATIWRVAWMRGCDRFQPHYRLN